MKKATFILTAILCLTALQFCSENLVDSRVAHPDISGWPELFNADLSNAIYPEGIWWVEDGLLTASEDQNIWTEKEYDNFILDLEFKTSPESNSGVIVYCSDVANWIPNSVEVQITDDFSDKWANAEPTWQCGAIFGHLPAKKQVVKKPGEWNRYTITCIDKMIYVVLNGEAIIEMNMDLWTSATVNPDSSAIPGWLSTPFAELATKGRIGFQGKHGGVPIYFRNIRIKALN